MMAKKNIRPSREDATTLQPTSEKSTILLDKEVIDLLKRAKEHPRQTYTELIRNMATLFISAKEKVSADQNERQTLRDKEIEDHISRNLLSSQNS